MITAARAIIIKDNNLLVMRRDKFGKQYYTLIGGHVEMRESTEKALIREVHEETMVRIANPRLVYIEHTVPPYGTQYVYLCEYISGVPALHPNADERAINKGGENIYTPMWLPLSKLPETNFRTENLKVKLLEGIRTNFADEVQEFQSSVEV